MFLAKWSLRLKKKKRCFLKGISFSLFFEWESLLLIKISSSFGKYWCFWSLPKGKGSLGGFLFFFFDSYLEPLSLPLCASNPTFVLGVFELDLSTTENGGWKWTQIRLFWVEARETDYSGTWGISHSSQGSGERLSFCTCRQLEPCFSQVHKIINICKTIVFVGWFVFVMARVRGVWTLKELDFEVYQLRSYWLLCHLEKYLRFMWTHDLSLLRVCVGLFSILAAMVNQLWLVVPFETLVQCAFL